jgi:lipopolysaccharide/colanic/teichoic acid biosynthesis glycosyltransferase
MYTLPANRIRLPHFVSTDYPSNGEAPEADVAAPEIFIYVQTRTDRYRRTLDLIGAAVLGAIAFPIVLLACLAIFFEDGKPLVFRQTRVGRFGRLFTIYKLRTMKKTVCGDAYKPSAGDSGVTRVGAILRKSSVDELPQLFNVLRGEMSIVGPRPEMPFIVRRYEKWQHLRLLANPGLTCIWQTECRSTVPLDDPRATMLDLAYIERASPAVDVGLVIRTVGAVLSTRGAR